MSFTSSRVRALEALLQVNPTQPPAPLPFPAKDGIYARIRVDPRSGGIWLRGVKVGWFVLAGDAYHFQARAAAPDLLERFWRAVTERDALLSPWPIVLPAPDHPQLAVPS